MREAADGKGVWFWHPWLVSSWRRFVGPDRASANRQFVSDGGQRNSAPGRARYKPYNHCAGKAGCSGAPCGHPCAFCAHDRGCLRAPGFPCALFVFGAIAIATPRARRAAGGCALKMGRAKRNPSALRPSRLMGIASLRPSYGSKLRTQGHPLPPIDRPEAPRPRKLPPG